MGLPNGAHVAIGGTSFLLDENYEVKTGRRPYNHYGRSLFTNRTDITGKPGAQNLNPDNLLWQITDFDGEGRVVFDRDRPGLFYRSEGLNFRVPGQFSLNRSSAPTTILDSAAASSTFQGAADFADVSGTSTTSGTDRKLVAVGDAVAATQNPGANRMQVDFYLYVDSFTSTTILGSAMHLQDGDGVADGTTWRVRPRSTARTAALSTGSQFTADTRQRVEFYLHSASGTDVNPAAPAVSVVDVTDNNNPKIVTSKSMLGIINTSAPSTPTFVLYFTPKSGHDYQFFVRNQSTGTVLIVDYIHYGPDLTANSATIAVYNNAAAIVTSYSIDLSSTAAGTVVGTLIYTGTAANYTYRVTRDSGNQAVWVDKVVTTAQSAATWTLDALELGLGGSVYAVGHRSATDSNVWTFDASTNSWTKGSALTGASNETCYALAHTDKYEYALMSGGKVYYTDNSGTHAAYTATMASILASSVGVGMCIAQDRLFVLCEDSTNGVYVRTFGVDGTPTVAESAHVQVTTAKNTADLTMRQRMCSSPTGARFFVNYSDVTAKVYECDSSGSSLVAKELADLGHGVKATAIAYEGGITFVTGQFVAESDQTPRSALWIIDQNGALQRIGFFRYDDPDANEPTFITPYQTNLYILQGPYVWRYSLTTGGLFLEYNLAPQDSTQARALAVMQGRTFALFGDDGSGSNSSEIWVSGTTGTYRQAAASDSNQFVSSVYDFGLPGFSKMLVKMQVITDELPADTSVRLEYQLDQDGTWVEVGAATSGTDNSFLVATSDTAVTFNTIQVRCTPASRTGVNTPDVLAIVVKALPAEDEEFFDLVLLCEDQDSSFRIDGEQESGDDKAALLNDLWRRKVPTNFIDGYAFSDTGVVNEYLVRVDDFRDERITTGEGRVVVTLRILT